jgi:hypothetical protein
MRLVVTGVLIAALAAGSIARPTLAFDEATIDATKACHDHVWFQVPDFGDLPNAAISAYPGVIDGETYIIFWNVRWGDPMTRAAGECTVVNGVVDAFEDYTKP